MDLHSERQHRGGLESVAERRIRERRIWRRALVLSVLLHAVILLFGPRGELPLPSSAAGPDGADDAAAAGSMTVVALSSAPPAPIVRPPPPVFDADVPETEPIPPEPFPEVPLDLPEIRDTGVGSTTGTDPGDAPDAGIPGAVGAGNAGTSERGRSGLVPPSPRGMIIPPTNGRLRGSRIEVWVFVDEQGRVVPDSTRLEPPTSDRGFNEQLVREAAQWIFEPARRNGAPVAAWFPYTISME
jgi:outer membrane biosynthesis protein TonB